MKLMERFDSGKTPEDYKLELHARCQKPSEDMVSYGDSLMELAENAYPEAAYSFKVELSRDQFMQGLSISDDLRKRSFMSQPGSLTEAIGVVRQLKSAHKACKTSGRNKSLNAVASSTADQKITAEIRELKELVLGISNKVEELEKKTPKGILECLARDLLRATCAVIRVTLRGTALLMLSKHKFRETVYGACKGLTRPRTSNKWGPRNAL